MVYFFKANIAASGYIITTYRLRGVHHLHYNKDYNRIPKRLFSSVGVHHLHYNKDYNFLSHG